MAWLAHQHGRQRDDTGTWTRTSTELVPPDSAEHPPNGRARHRGGTVPGPVGAASRPACDPSPYRLDSQEPASLDPEDGSDGSDGSDDSDGPDGADEPLDGVDEPPEGADGAPEGGADGAPIGADPDGGRGPNPRPGP